MENLVESVRQMIGGQYASLAEYKNTLKNNQRKFDEAKKLSIQTVDDLAETSLRGLEVSFSR